jgi:hypothetical protein
MSLLPRKLPHPLKLVHEEELSNCFAPNSAYPLITYLYFDTLAITLAITVFATVYLQHSLPPPSGMMDGPYSVLKRAFA